MLDGIADALAALGSELPAIAAAETGLAEARLASERDRTVNQLRMFAALIGEGEWQEPIIEPGDAARAVRPRPDLRRLLRPLGPVAVFGASNFPLAYSVAGGDTASALAAGCPVVVKGHAAHPRTGLLVAEIVAAAVRRAGVDEGVFSFLLAGGERDVRVGEELVMQPGVRAVGFTGSVGGGMAIVRRAASRQEPIPVFAEMGSVNPVFVLPEAAARRAAEIAERLSASILGSAGQMCTCPGLIILPPGAAGDGLVEEIAARVAAAAPQVMLSWRTVEAFQRRTAEISEAPGVRLLARGAAGAPEESGAMLGVARLFEVDATRLLPSSPRGGASPSSLWEECFGPCAIVVRSASAAEREELAAQMPGSLTASLFLDEGDEDDMAEAALLVETLADRAGRLVFNGVPTGVEVALALVHGGPHPACSRPESTAVGPLAIRRWLRPVCWQNAPPALLPAALRS